VAAGAAVTVVEAMFKSDANAAFPSMKDLTNLIKAITEFVKQFGKLKAGAQLIVVGLILFGAGRLVARHEAVLMARIIAVHGFRIGARTGSDASSTGWRRSPALLRLISLTPSG